MLSAYVVGVLVSQIGKTTFHPPICSFREASSSFRLLSCFRWLLLSNDHPYPLRWGGPHRVFVEHAGSHEVILHAEELAMGVYVHRLTAAAFVQTRKLMVLM